MEVAIIMEGIMKWQEACVEFLIELTQVIASSWENHFFKKAIILVKEQLHFIFLEFGVWSVAKPRTSWKHCEHEMDVKIKGG